MIYVRNAKNLLFLDTTCFLTPWILEYLYLALKSKLKFKNKAHTRVYCISISRNTIAYKKCAEVYRTFRNNFGNTKLVAWCTLTCCWTEIVKCIYTLGDFINWKSQSQLTRFKTVSLIFDLILFGGLTRTLTLLEIFLNQGQITSFLKNKYGDKIYKKLKKLAKVI